MRFAFPLVGAVTLGIIAAFAAANLAPNNPALPLAAYAAVMATASMAVGLVNALRDRSDLRLERIQLDKWGPYGPVLRVDFRNGGRRVAELTRMGLWDSRSDDAREFAFGWYDWHWRGTGSPPDIHKATVAEDASLILFAPIFMLAQFYVRHPPRVLFVDDSHRRRWRDLPPDVVAAIEPELVKYLERQRAITAQAQ